MSFEFDNVGNEWIWDCSIPVYAFYCSTCLTSPLFQHIL